MSRVRASYLFNSPIFKKPSFKSLHRYPATGNAAGGSCVNPYKKALQIKFGQVNGKDVSMPFSLILTVGRIAFCLVCFAPI